MFFCYLDIERKNINSTHTWWKLTHFLFRFYYSLLFLFNPFKCSLFPPSLDSIPYASHILPLFHQVWLWLCYLQHAFLYACINHGLFALCSNDPAAHPSHCRGWVQYSVYVYKIAIKILKSKETLLTSKTGNISN